MTKINTTHWDSLSGQQQAQLLQRPVLHHDEQLADRVGQIIEQVKNHGDQALLALAERFDQVSLDSLMLDRPALEHLAADLPDKVKQAIDTASEQIRCFHLAQQTADIQVETRRGVVCELRQRPLEKVGLYIPGGTAPLPSTVLMLGIPAQIAGNRQRIMCTPPNAQGQIHPAIAYAALRCDINEVYLAGGAQAIAAMAYGTKTIGKADKLFGPGNRYVTMAKQLIGNSDQCVAIDMPAGPSEVMVIADGQANADFIAADLLSQAEHGPDSQVMLVSDSRALIDRVHQAVGQQLARLPRQSIAAAALQHSAFILTASVTQSIAIANAYAPEHLIIQSENAAQVSEQIDNASSIFVGAWSPESAGDYASGTNHVLPTYGYSRVLSSLGLADFCKRFTVQTLSAEGLSGLGSTIMDLAAAEGLEAHRNAVAIRLAALQNNPSKQ